MLKISKFVIFSVLPYKFLLKKGLTMSSVKQILAYNKSDETFYLAIWGQG
jgi:hypothetical protein